MTRKQKNRKKQSSRNAATAVSERKTCMHQNDCGSDRRDAMLLSDIVIVIIAAPIYHRRQEIT